MKTLAKYFFSALLLFFGVLIISQLVVYNVRADELNNIVTTAMTNTQTVMQEQIEDEEYKTNNKRYAINTNDEYIAEFTRNLYMLKTSDSKLTIDVYGVDYKKGLLSVGVKSSFNLWNGNLKTIEARRTVVIEQLNSGS